MIFLDTGFIVALELEKDENHKAAVRINKEIASAAYGHTYISDYVLDEILTLIMARTNDVSMAVKTGTYLKPSANLIRIGDYAFDEAWNIFKSQKVARFSFTDCTSISVMKEHDIKNIATFDKSFKDIAWINVLAN